MEVLAVDRFKQWIEQIHAQRMRFKQQICKISTMIDNEWCYHVTILQTAGYHHQQQKNYHIAISYYSHAISVHMNFMKQMKHMLNSKDVDFDTNTEYIPKKQWVIMHSKLVYIKNMQ